jgi:hypothetical protein
LANPHFHIVHHLNRFAFLHQLKGFPIHVSRIAGILWISSWKLDRHFRLRICRKLGRTGKWFRNDFEVRFSGSASLWFRVHSSLRQQIKRWRADMWKWAYFARTIARVWPENRIAGRFVVHDSSTQFGHAGNRKIRDADCDIWMCVPPEKQHQDFEGGQSFFLLP